MGKIGPFKEFHVHQIILEMYWTKDAPISQMHSLSLKTMAKILKLFGVSMSIGEKLRIEWKQLTRRKSFYCIRTQP